MLLTDFYTIVDKLLESAVMVYTVSNNAILIDDPRVSLFSMMMGFAVLEFILMAIMWFRPGRSGATSTGKSARRGGGDIQL
jgi:hypothetical protein